MKRLSLFTLLAVLAIMLAGCAPAAAPATAISLTDGLDRAVNLAGPAQRVVSLAPSNTEILFAIGAGAQVVGRDAFTNFPVEAVNLPDIGGSMNEYNMEQIVGLKPDLILMSSLSAAEQVKAFEDLNLTVFYLENPTDLDGLYANLKIVGQLTGHAAEAEALAEDLAKRVAAVEEKIAGATERPTIFYELDGTDPAKPWTSGPGTFMDLLITKAGGQNIGASLSSAWAQISQEELIVQNPQVILMGDSIWGMTAEQVAARPGWDVIQAVKDNRILPFNDDLVSRPGPRLVNGLEELAKILHPELYK